jgi:ADP-heptose:LPS heptosyltransferase
VGRRLAEAGVQVWVASGPHRDERSLAEEIVRLGDGALVLAPETRSIEDLIALQSRCGIFLACDSGPLHVASLVGVPVVQLLGPTHPAQNAPWSAGPVRCVRVPLPCSPCRRGCADPACMRVLAPGTVARAALELLEAERAGGEASGGGGANVREAGEAGA